MSVLRIEGLTASYGVSQALFGVNLSIDEGGVTALMGRNGMGKSTTVKAICRMIRSQGTLQFAGRDCTLCRATRWPGLAGLCQRGGAVLPG